MGIIIREVDLDHELDRLKDVFNSNFTIKGSDERFRWLYLDNPDGRSTAWFVIDDRTGGVAGCTAVFPRRIRLAGTDRVVVGWNCGDFCISPRYRTMGVAIKLRRAARDAVDAGRVPFLYAHPNDRMLQVHLKVGHAPIGTMVRYAKVLRFEGSFPGTAALSSFALRFAGTDILKWSGSEAELLVPDAPLAELAALDVAMSGSRTSLVRDAAYVDWRFRRNPAQPHEIIVTRHRGRLAGYLAFAMKDRVAMVKDWRARDKKAWQSLFVRFLEEIRGRCALSASVTLLDGHPDIPLLKRFGFVLRPETSIAVGYAPEGTFARERVMNGRAWYMTVGDRDI